MGLLDTVNHDIEIRLDRTAAPFATPGELAGAHSMLLETLLRL